MSTNHASGSVHSVKSTAALCKSDEIKVMIRSEAQLAYRQRLDRIKNEYAESTGLHILRIAYSQLSGCQRSLMRSWMTSKPSRNTVIGTPLTKMDSQVYGQLRASI